MVAVDEVTAVLVTRGDHEQELQDIIGNLIFDEVVVWNNASPGKPDLGAFGRYEAAMTQASTRFVFFQDDDCTVPADAQHALVALARPGLWVSNMNPNHNAGMPLLALPGYGAVVDTALIAPAVAAWDTTHPFDCGETWLRVGCDIVIPCLCPSEMHNLGWESFGYAWAPERTFQQPGYAGLKRWFYDEAVKLRASMEAA